MTHDEHRARHVLLHEQFDELCADYLTHNRGSLPSKTTMAEMIRWSHEQTIDPTESGEHRELPAVCSRCGKSYDNSDAHTCEATS